MTESSRRHFLKSTAVGVTAFSGAQALTQAPELKQNGCRHRFD
jgi:hypothetical protein